MTTVSAAFDAALEHHRAGRLSEAEQLYRQVLDVEPRHADALYLLGRLKYQRQHFAEAAALIGQAIALDPGEATFHQHLAESLRAQGELQPALAAYRRAIELNPRYAVAWSSLAVALTADGCPEEAEQAYRQTIALQADLPEPHNNLGALLRQRGCWDEARQEFETALRLRGDFVEAWNNLGNALRDGGDLPAALAAYRRSLSLAPDYAAAHFNLGVGLQRQGDAAGAAEAFRQAVRCGAGDAEALANLGAALNDLGDSCAAADACRQALAIDPQSAVAIGNLGVALQAQGQIDEAIAAYRVAIKLDPDNAGTHGNLLYALNFHPRQDPAAVLAEHRAWAMRHADPLTTGHAPHANDRSPERRLRVGYVSAHFRAHAVNVFAEPLLSAHAREAVELFCYSNVPQALCDATTDRLRSRADQWREIAALGDEQAAQQIRDDRIDVLVDLTGHIAGNRLLVFARKPAPVQVTYLGYQNTTGMRAMDYRLTDAWADPPGMTDDYYTECLERLPRAFFCYQPWPGAPPVAPGAADSGRSVTLGSLNSFAKVTTEVLETWTNLLACAPLTRLIVLTPVSPQLRKRVDEILQAQGVDPRRVELYPRCSQSEYLRLMQRIDIALDPFPFNGHTTTCDALWQGLPVVSLAGGSYASRFGSSALRELGLEDLIVSSTAQYIEIAAQLAADTERLGNLRKSLRGRMVASTLLDAEGFARSVETAYRRMWQRWCAAQNSGALT